MNLRFSGKLMELEGWKGRFFLIFSDLKAIN